jgi:hypothetical protein
LSTGRSRTHGSLLPALADANCDRPSTGHAHDLNAIHHRAKVEIEVEAVEDREAIEGEEERAYRVAAEIEEMKAAGDDRVAEIEAAIGEARVAEVEAVTAEGQRIRDRSLSHRSRLPNVGARPRMSEGNRNDESGDADY